MLSYHHYEMINFFIERKYGVIAESIILINETQFNTFLILK